MKIALVSCNIGMSYGMRALSALLKREGHEVEFLFASRFNKSPSLTKETLAQLYKRCEGVELVGLSAMGYTVEAAKPIIDHFKSLGVPVVLGGIYPTLAPKKAIEFCDIICVGEAEGAFLEFIDKLEKKEDYTKVQNFWFKKDGAVISNPPRGLMQNLDDLPIPDYDMATQYVLRDEGIEQSTGAILYDENDGTFRTATMRGCPHHCAYCCHSMLRKIYKDSPGAYVRRRSVPAVIKELKLLKSLSPRGKRLIITLEDDDFFSRPLPEIEEFSQAYKEEIGVPFFCNTTPTSLSEKKLELLLGAGLLANSTNGLGIGLESASQVTLKMYERDHISEKIIARAQSILHKFNICTGFDTLIANPYEKKEDILYTIRFILSMPAPFKVLPHLLSFYDGMELRKKAEEDGIANYFAQGDYKSHFAYLKENKFLHNLSFWIGGKVTGYRVGGIPRFMMPWLLKESTISWMDAHQKMANLLYYFFRFNKVWFALFDAPGAIHFTYKYKGPRHVLNLFLERFKFLATAHV